MVINSQHFGKYFTVMFGFVSLFGFGMLEFSVRHFKIPTGSMTPTLLVGDHVITVGFIPNHLDDTWRFRAAKPYARLVTKRIVRVDLVVFKLPSNLSTDYVKRIVGMPGDRIQMKGGVLYINDSPCPRKRIEDFPYQEYNGAVIPLAQYIETLPNGVQYRIIKMGDHGPLDNTPLYQVPAGNYFTLGDNRDNSQDSRVLSAVGYIPAENFVGLIKLISYSRLDDSFIPKLRWDRFLTAPDSFRLP
jgi:signal peptidase I